MSIIYKPKQNLAFRFDDNRKKLYVVNYLSIPVRAKDKCTKKSSTDMDKEAFIRYEVVTVDQNTSNPFDDEVLMKLLDGVNVSPPDLVEKLKAIIEADLKRKKIKAYKVNTSVTKPSTSEGNHKTDTISGDGTIEIDKSGEIEVFEMETPA